jgi:hypothetical protein
MLEPENRKLEWVLSAIFGVGSVVFILVFFAYFSNQADTVGPERNHRRTVSENGPVKAGQTQGQPDSKGQLDDPEEKHPGIASSKAGSKDQHREALSREVVLAALGRQEATLTIDVSGSPEAPFKIGQLVGTSSPNAITRGDDDHSPGPEKPSSDQPAPAVVSKESTLLSYTGDTVGQRNSTVVLKAELFETEAPRGDVSGNEVVFTVTDGISTQIATAITDSNGTAQVSTPVSLPAGLYDIKVAFVGDDYRLGSSTEASFVAWEAIAGLNINGSGWLAEDSEKVSFGFSIKYTKKSDVPQGQLQIVDKSKESGLDIQTEGFNWLVVTSDNLALLQGSASLNGESGYLFEMLVSDNGTPGKGKDFFELSIYGVPVASGLIDGGNIVIQ